jgi:hypothetical protein
MRNPDSINDGDQLNMSVSESTQSESGFGISNNFGKIFKGEHFNTVLTIQNTSAIYTLDRIKMRVIVNR